MNGSGGVGVVSLVAQLSKLSITDAPMNMNDKPHLEEKPINKLNPSQL